jgi:carbamoyltransferase
MLVLGINEDHNGSVALVRDGEVLATASEERFTRIKNDVGYPWEAIEFVLNECNISPDDCDRVVYSTEVQDPVALKIKRISRFTIKDYVREMHEYWRPKLLENRSSNFWDEVLKDPRLADPRGVHYNFSFLDTLPVGQWIQAFQEARRQVVTKHLSIPADRVSFVDHHTAHAHYAYFAAPLDRTQKTAVVTADGWGDGCNATISVAQGDSIKEIHRTPMCNLARLYRWATLILGMKPDDHEYKVMGLAPYANERTSQPAYEIYKETLVVDGLDFRWDHEPSDMYFYFKERFEREGVRFDGIAGGLQKWMEEMVTKWLTNVLTTLDVDRLVFSGGLAMNVKANKAIADLDQIKDFFVAPSAGDESLGMGAAFVACRKEDPIQPLTHVYLGTSPSEDEVLAALKQYQAYEHFEVSPQPDSQRVADLLAQGMVIARCMGRMEFGARALGNRSILCDPSQWDSVRKINEQIKFRDFWMPFTPTILAERAEDYLVNPKGLIAPFMTIAFDSKPLARKDLRAAIHPYDYTIRPQVLERSANPEYYDIIKAFEKRTGIGGLLNTSFNLHGEPIVRTPVDAMHTFVNSDLDGLLMPGVIVQRKQQP